MRTSWLLLEREGILTMTIEKLFPSGDWCVSDIIGGYRVKRVYYFYTKREAIAEFRREMKGKL